MIYELPNKIKMFNRPQFGNQQNTGFGFGAPAANQSPFGQTSQLFGSTATSTGQTVGFGSAPSAFGAATAPVFGQQPNSSSGLFGTTQTPSFGTTGTTPGGFGSTLFNQPSQPGSSGMFGAAPVASFGQQKPPGFGFSTAATAATNMFGANTQQQQQPQQQAPQMTFNQTGSSSLFGPPSAFNAGVAAAATGTVIKFNPITGTDSMQKSGTSTMINTKHHCITCMKEYENKSLEELRFEDYSVNRKGPQQGQVFGGVPGQQPFGAGIPSSGATVFGTDNKPYQMSFGQQNTATGTTGAFGSGMFNTTQPGTGAFNFSAPGTATGIFGSTQQQQPSLFGPAQQQPQAANTSFGVGLFGQQQPGGIFSKGPTAGTTGGFNQQPATGAANTGFNFSNPSGSGLFATPAKPPGAPTGGFGTGTMFPSSSASSTSFGQPAGGFGSTGGFGTAGAFGKPNLFQPTATVAGTLGTQSGLSLGGGLGQPQSTAQPFYNLGGTTSTTGLFAQPAVSGLNTSNMQSKPMFGGTVATAPATGSLFAPTPAFGGLQQQTTATQLPQSMWGGSSIGGGGLFGMGQQHNSGIGGGLLGGGTGLTGFGGGMGLGQPMMNTMQSSLSTSANTGLANPVLEASLTADVFGYQPHLQGLEPKLANSDGTGSSNTYRSVTTDAREITRLLEDGLRSPVSNTVSSNKRLPILLPPKTKKEMLLWDDMSYNIEDRDKANINMTNNVRRLRLSEKVLAKEQPRRDDSFSSTKQLDDFDSSRTQLSAQVTNREQPPSYPTGDFPTTKFRNRSVNVAESGKSSAPSATESPKSTDIRESGEHHQDDVITSPKSSIPENVNDNSKAQKSPRSTQTITAEISPPPRKNPVKLTKDEYYTLPELDTLPDYMDENGKCIIRGFTIGRVGYGNVCFTDYMDVTGLDLDKHVHFRHKEIIVYSDDSEKPPLGQGLNRPAQVTLDNVFPRNNQGEPIRDLRALADMRYGEKLRMLDSKYGIRSMDYRPETGSWVFTVSHFSKYGCTDSDDEVIVETLPVELKHRLDVGAQQGTSGEQELQGIATPRRTDDMTMPGDLSKVLSSVFSPIAKDKGGPSALKTKTVKDSFIVADDSSDDTPSSESLEKTAAHDPCITNMDDIEEERRQSSASMFRRHTGLGGVAVSSPLPPKRSFVAKDTIDVIETPDDFFDAEDADDDDDADVCDKCDQIHLDDDQCPGTFVLDTSTRRKRFVGMQRSLPMASGALSQFGLKLFFDDLGDTSPTTKSSENVPMQQQQQQQQPVLATRGRRVAYLSSKTNSQWNAETLMEEANDEMAKVSNEGDRLINRPLSMEPKVYTLVNKHRTFTGQLSRNAAVSSVLLREPLRLKSTVPSSAIVDMCAMLRRSFRVGWGRGFSMATILSPGSNDTDNTEACNVVDIDMYSPQAVVVVDASRMGLAVDDGINHQDPFGDFLGEFFEIMKSESESVPKEGNAPHYRIKPGFQSLLRLAELAKIVSQQQPGNERAMYHYHIWSLLKTLWGGGRDTMMAQRHKFNDWLEQVTADLTVQDIKRHRGKYFQDRRKHVAHEIFILLAGHKVHDAATVAAQEGLSNLSLLLSQLNSNADTRSIISFQKAWWKHFGWDGLIPESIHKLYLIVAGLMFDDEKPTSINVVGTFDWLRTLGILFWYISDENKKFIHPIHVYTKIILEYDFIARPCSRFNPTSNYYDVLYYILVLSMNYINNIEEIITPGTHTDDPNDYRLSWLLMQSLCALRKGRIDVGARYNVCVRLSAQLENAGLIKWAVFVLMYIDDPDSRRDHIMAVLYRNIGVVEEHDAHYRAIDKQVVELVRDFGVPVQWIHKIKAVRYGLLGMHWNEFRHLAKARKMVGWKPSQKVFLEKLAPSLILNNHFNALDACLSKAFGDTSADTGTDSLPYNMLISQQEDGNYGQISMGISILKTFCRLRRFMYLSMADQLTILTTNNMQIRSDIHFLAKNLHRYPISTYKDCASLAQLAVSLNEWLYDRMAFPHLKDLLPIVNVLRNELPTLLIPPDNQMQIHFQSFQAFA